MPRRRSNKFKVLTELPSIEDAEGAGLLNLFDPDNPDIQFFNLLDEENIRLAGSPILYYKYYQNKVDHDDVYMESKNKPIAKGNIRVFGHYEPAVIEENLTEFGIELTNDQLFTFNKSYIETKLNRLPIPGDLLRPEFQDIKYEIVEVQEDSFEIYGVYHVACTAKILRDSEETVDRNIPDTPDTLGGFSKH